MKRLRIGAAIRVDWLDTAVLGGAWPDLESAKPVKIESVGQLAKVRRRYIVLATNRNREGEQWGGLTVIPRGCIARIRKL